MPDLPHEVRALFDAPNYVALASLLPDGSPHNVTVWGGVDGDRVFFFTQSASRNARNPAPVRRVPLPVNPRANPFHTAWVRGRFVETREGEDALPLIDVLSRKYTGA